MHVRNAVKTAEDNIAVLPATSFRVAHDGVINNEGNDKRNASIS